MYRPRVFSDHAGDVARILSERARRMAMPAEARPSSGPPHLVARVGPRRVAVPMSALRQVVTPPRVTRLPGPSFLGLVALAGDLIPVVELSALLQIDAPKMASDPLLLIIEDGDSRLGLRVDAVEGQTTVRPQDIAGASVARSGAPCLATPTLGDDLLVLDISATLADPRLSLVPAGGDREPESHR